MNKAIKQELVGLYQEIAKLKNKVHAIRGRARATAESTKRDVFCANMSGAHSGLDRALEHVEQAMDNCDREFK